MILLWLMMTEVHNKSSCSSLNSRKSFACFHISAAFGLLQLNAKHINSSSNFTLTFIILGFSVSLSHHYKINMHREGGKNNAGNQITIWILFLHLKNENVLNALNILLDWNAYVTCKWECNFQMSMHIQDVYFYTNRTRTYGPPITVYQQVRFTPETTPWRECAIICSF